MHNRGLEPDVGRQGGRIGASTVHTDELLEREAELAAVERLIASSGTPPGSILYVEGPAGIGKTRLLDEACAIARIEGVTILSAQATEMESTTSFGVVRQLFEPAVAALPAVRRAEILSGAARLAADLVDPSMRRPDADERDQTATLHGLYWLLDALADIGPLAVVVDDAHWADAASVRWLSFMGTRIGGLRAALLVAARPDECPPALAVLRDEPSVELARLRELTPEGSADLVRSLLDAGAEPTFCAACHRASGGNPFLLRELLAALRADCVATTAAGADRIEGLAPAPVERAVERRLAAVGPGATRLARAVAVLGACELAPAASLASLDREQAIDAADQLIAAEILRPDRPLRFHHALVQAAVYSAIPPRRRAAMHGDAARALWEAAVPIEQVVAHLLECDPAEEAWVVEALRSAATQAAGGGDPESAVTLLRRALAEPPAPADLPATLLELGTIEAHLREPEAIEHLWRAFAGAPDDAARRDAGLALHRALGASFRWREAVDVIDRAKTALPASPDLQQELEIELIANVRLNPSTRPAALRRLTALGVPDRARRSSDRLLLAVLAHEAELAGDPADTVVELARRALGQNALLAEQGPGSPSLYYAAQALAAADHVEEAERHYASALEAARQRGSVLGFVLASCFRSGSALRRGAIRAAEAEARAALEATDENGWGPGQPAAAAFLVAALIERDKLDEADEVLLVNGLGDGSAPDSLVGNHLLLNRGRLRIARSDLRGGVDDLLAFGRRVDEWGAENPAAFPWRSGAAVALTALGDRAQARRLAELELELARAFGAPRAIGIALRGAGVARGGKRGQRLLREAIDVLDDSPARLDLARALADLGAAIHGDGDAEGARAPLRRALDLAHRCGADALSERTRERLRAAGGRPRRPVLSGRESLTPSELRVCEMAAGGMKNREVAQALFVTVPTVEAHLRNAYRKLEIASREELPSALGEELPG